MGIGAGISATLGIATETTPGTPVAVTRFLEFDSESLSMKKHTAQGAGMRGGALVKRGSRRNVVAREAAGDISLDVPTSGFGLLLQHMLGSFTGSTPTSIGGGLFQQIHNPASAQGKAFTTQIVKPDTSGALGPFTYPGCKVTGWELSIQQSQQLKLKLSIDALDEATPSNTFAATTLAAATIAGASSFTTTATIPAGSYVKIDTGLNSEVILTGTPTGTGPFTIPVASGTLANAHATGVVVSSATGANYGAAVALQTASFAATAGVFSFEGGKIIAGGSTTVVSGVWTNTGGQAVANVRQATLKGTNPLKVDRWGMGSAVRSEQLENNWRTYAADVQVEYNGPAFYQAYAADEPMELVLSFAAPGGAKLSFYAPVGFQNDGATPQVGGPDIIIQKLAYDILDDGVNGYLQAVYVSTDSVV